MTFPPQYFFYGIVCALVVLIWRFVHWWWRDALVTTAATQIARQALRTVGIDDGCPPKRILELLTEAKLDDNLSNNLIIASLYLLRSEFHLNRSFFTALAKLPGYESSSGLPAPPALFEDIRHFIFESQSNELPKRQELISQAVDRLVDNLAELERAGIRPQKVAA